MIEVIFKGQEKQISDLSKFEIFTPEIIMYLLLLRTLI